MLTMCLLFALPILASWIGRKICLQNSIQSKWGRNRRRWKRQLSNRYFSLWLNSDTQKLWCIMQASWLKTLDLEQDLKANRAVRTLLYLFILLMNKFMPSELYKCPQMLEFKISPFWYRRNIKQPIVNVPFSSCERVSWDTTENHLSSFTEHDGKCQLSHHANQASVACSCALKHIMRWWN